MANIIFKKPWENLNLKPTDEDVYFNRRTILKQLGMVTGGLIAAPFISACAKEAEGPEIETFTGDNDFTFEGMDALYPASQNTAYSLDRPITIEAAATQYNNFYEFIDPDDPSIYNAHRYVSTFDTRDWKIEVSGLANNTGVFHLGDLITEMGLEERLYRHRCVEAWAMAVPWTGFPLSKLINFFEPNNKATHIAMISSSKPSQMVGVRTQDWYPWPYFEGLRMDEAMNELTFMATGLYGKPIPKQNGAPIRLVVPWKYGYKSIKSIVKIAFTDRQPGTFWNQTVPEEYGFLSNVEPSIPHPRWSQENEWLLPDPDNIWKSQRFNGYGDYVAHLY